MKRSAFLAPAMVLPLLLWQNPAAVAADTGEPEFCYGGDGACLTPEV